MFIGKQFEAPEGYGSFQKEVRYYFAGDRSDGTVLIVWFALYKHGWRAHIMTPLRADFEAALTDINPKLRVSGAQYALPEWLLDVEGIDFDEIETYRYKKKQTYRAQVESRLLKIADVLHREQVILNSEDPLATIAAFARDGTGNKHPHRLQVWFFAYVLHGRNLWALKQPTQRVGQWSRTDELHSDKKYGRPSLSGTCYGWSSSGMRAEIVENYLNRCGPGISMKTIHRATLSEHYGCKTQDDSGGNLIYYHSENERFPSYGQFRSIVVKELGLDVVQKKIYGAARIRSKATSEKGNYTEQYANILEGLEVDAYYCDERPKAMHSDEPSEPLAVSEAVCPTTGANAGIGFSIISEDKEAYRSMLFCMAVPKSYTAKMYGIPPADLNWIMQGLPAHFISDRGPAGYRNLVERLEQSFPMKSIVPSYSGQSKPNVESTHPRSVNLEGAPSYVVSDLNVIQMMKREIYRAASSNHTKDISGRLSDQAIRDFRNEGRIATPHHYWDYLNKRLRTCAREISLEEAVRAFWTPCELRLDKVGVQFRHRHYTSEALKSSGVLNRLSGTASIPIRAYVLSLVVRIVWVEVGGRLIEVEACMRTRISDEDRLVPLSEYEETAIELAELKSRTRLSAEAARAKAENDFKANTGIGWNDGERRGGSPKRATGTTAHEVKVAKGRGQGAKAA